MAHQKSDIGLFITLPAPTRTLTTEATAAGFYTSASGKKFARIQVLTIEGLLDHTQRAEHPDCEPNLNFKKAKAERTDDQRVFELPG